MKATLLPNPSRMLTRSAPGPVQLPSQGRAASSGVAWGQGQGQKPQAGLFATGTRIMVNFTAGARRPPLGPTVLVCTCEFKTRIQEGASTESSGLCSEVSFSEAPFLTPTTKLVLPSTPAVTSGPFLALLLRTLPCQPREPERTLSPETKGGNERHAFPKASSLKITASPGYPTPAQ